MIAHGRIFYFLTFLVVMFIFVIKKLGFNFKLAYYDIILKREDYPVGLDVISRVLLSEKREARETKSKGM